MTDSVLVVPPGWRLTNAGGSVVSGGKLKFYNAGTLVTRTVYSNFGLSSSLGSTVFCGSDGLPVASSGSSTPVSVYTGTTPYKIVATTSADVTIWTLDNLVGALDTSTFLTTGSTSTLSIPVVSKTTTYTLVAADRGKLVQGNASGGNFTLSLDAAATLGDGWNAETRNSGSSGQVMLAASEAIAFEGGSFTSRALEIGEAMTIRCDGTAFKIAGHTPPLMSSRGPGVITITDRVTSAPVSPTPGARYIVQTGFSTFATHDIIEANSVSFNKYTPATDCGWIAYVQDEDRYYSFQGSAWVLGLEPAASATVAGVQENADQAEMEARSSILRSVSPGMQHFHPTHPKAGGVLNGTGTPALLTGDVGLGVVTDNGAGTYSIALDTAFSDTNWWVQLTSKYDGSGTAPQVSEGTGARSASSLSILNTDAGGAGEDSAAISIALWGDYA